MCMVECKACQGRRGSGCTELDCSKSASWLAMCVGKSNIHTLVIMVPRGRSICSTAHDMVLCANKTAGTTAGCGLALLKCPHTAVTHDSVCAGRQARRSKLAGPSKGNDKSRTCRRLGDKSNTIIYFVYDLNMSPAISVYCSSAASVVRGA